MKSRRTRFAFPTILLGLVVSWLAVFLCCNKESPTEAGNGGGDDATHDIVSSEIMEDCYRIYISLPESHTGGLLGYPVIYLLDGDWYFDGSHPRSEDGGVTGLVTRLSQQGFLPESIVVGIGYPGDNMRGRDFLWEHFNFYRFLTEELIPHIDENQPTDPAAGRTLIGHSDGGYFTMYAFLQYDPQGDHPFQRFLSISGDFSKPYVNLYNSEAYQYQRIGAGGILAADLFLAVGGMEEERFVDSNRQMTERLESRDYQEFRFESRIYPFEDHGGVVQPAIEHGLMWLFYEW